MLPLLANGRALRREDLAEVAAILRSRGDGRGLELFYEDLFLADQDTRWRLVESLWAHLGLPRCASPRLGGFLENTSFRMEGPATYGRLPNLAEIEATLGSDDTGHIGYLKPLERPAAQRLTPHSGRLCPGGRTSSTASA